MNALSLADRIDVTNVDQLAALCRPYQISLESLQSVARALAPVGEDVRFYVMR